VVFDRLDRTRADRGLSYALDVKGDRVEIVIAADDGSRTYEIAATRAGRRVEVSNSRGVVEVVELTRTGQAVRTARFMASRVIALVEHPAGEAPSDRRGAELSSYRPPEPSAPQALWPGSDAPGPS
jgi:hypothetical protein